MFYFLKLSLGWNLKMCLSTLCSKILELNKGLQLALIHSLRLTEKLNSTLINALRKHTEQNHQSWPAWLDWVLFSYRTRVHSSTGFCPFSLTFGKKANTFRDWRNKPDKYSELELIARSQEIKNLFDRKRLLALENIAKSQEAQKTSQYKRHNVLIEPLAICTKVMVKNHDKLVKKLEARYRGPDTVVSVQKTTIIFLRMYWGLTYNVQYLYIN